VVGVSGSGERGEISLGLVAVMAIIVGAVWAVPMVFLQHEEADRAADLIGGSAAHAPAGGAGAATAPADPVGASNDVRAQADLANAVVVAQTYFAENGSLGGFTPQVASGLEPSITFTAGAASSGAVSIRGVTATSVVLVTTTARGPLCAAVDSGAVSRGRVDAQSPAQCAGGW
jgi:hypothetical protein